MKLKYTKYGVKFEDKHEPDFNFEASLVGLFLIFGGVTSVIIFCYSVSKWIQYVFF